MSEHMDQVLAFIRENGGIATPVGGGYWHANHKQIPGANITQTIYALERRGQLKRRMFSKYPWADSYACVTVRVTRDV